MAKQESTTRVRSLDATETAETRETPTCEHCGSVLSIVTWTCVRGAYCPGARKAGAR